MLQISKDTELSVISNGRRSSLPATWWSSRQGGKANLLDPACNKTNVLLDALSGEPLMLTDAGLAEMIEIETNYAPRVGTHLIFCAPLGAALQLYWGGSLTVRKASDLVGAQLKGDAGMYCVVAARSVMRQTYLSNASAIAGVQLAANPENPKPWPPPASGGQKPGLDYGPSGRAEDDDDDDKTPAKPATPAPAEPKK